MDKLYLDTLRLSGEDMVTYWGEETDVKEVRVDTGNRKNFYLARIAIGPDLTKARSLGSVAFVLYQLINTAHKMNPRDMRVILPPKLLNPFHLHRQAVSNAIVSLERAGLIEVQRQPGRKNRYRVLAGG